MDSAQGETGGKSLTSKLKVTRVKDKVKNLKNRLPGMKKHDDEGHEDSSEYDNDSPKGTGAETGYNGSESTPFSTATTTSASHGSNFPPSNETSSPREVYNQNYDSRPSQISPSGYDAQTRNYVPTGPPMRPAPMPADPPRSNLAPSMEEKFRYMDVGDNPPRRVENPQTVRSYQPEQQFAPSETNPQTDPIRSYQPEQGHPPSVTNPQTDPIRSYQPEQQFTPSETNPQTDPIRSYQPEQEHPPSVTNPQTDPIRSYQLEQQYSPSMTESMQKGYSDVPRNSYRANFRAPADKGMVEKVKESVTGAAIVLGDKMGYYNDTPAAPGDPNAPSILGRAKSALGLDRPRDPNAPSVLDRAKTTLGSDKPRDPNEPSVVDKAKTTLGMDKPRDPNAPPLTEKAKAYMGVASQKTREYGATVADRAAWTKDRVAYHTTPTHHDKALSEQVTQSLSTLPGAIREKVFGPASPSANTTNSPRTPGIAGRVSGAVSSLFGSAPQGTGERLQHTFPAHSDDREQPVAASVPQNLAGRSSAEERMPATSTPAYPPSYPMVSS